MKKLCLVLALLMAVAALQAASMEMTSARLYKKQGEFEKALQYYDAELQKNPTNGEALFERGQLLGDITMSPANAALAKRLAGDANPQRVLIERMLSDFDKAKVNTNEKGAKKLNKQISEIILEDWNTFYVASVHEDSAKAYDKAVEQADMAILLMPNDWRAYGHKAQVLDRLDRRSEAMPVWEAACDHLHGSNWEQDKPKEYRQAMDIIRGRLLEGHFNAGDHAKTIQLADEILMTDAENGDAIQFKAFSLAQMASDTTRPRAERDSLRAVAIGFLAAARKQRSDYPPIVYTIGQFNLQSGDTAAAIASFEDYVKMDVPPIERRDAQFVLGVIYLEGGSFVNTEKARDTFKAITDQFPDDAPAWTNYGVALIRLGDNSGGKKAIEHAKSLGGSK
jgi:tetratricopeptide (TPR) repeat protein